MTNLRFICAAIALIFCASIGAKPSSAPSIEPPYWWTGMANHRLQLMVHHPGIRDAVTSVDYPGVTIDSIARLDSPNYQLIYLNIDTSALPGKCPITFKTGKKTFHAIYQLRERDGKPQATFDASDVLYLIMPDRFADGNPDNNAVSTLRFPAKVDRSDPNARHGGDLAGIRKHLGYIDSLGVTAIWLNPVLENDMPGGSYHGYATTDYYRVDPRLGTNDEYTALIADAHSRHLKVVMDMIFNHSGSEHPWMADMPAHDWFNNPKGDKFTNFNLATVNDPYASRYDLDRTVKGWFVPSMPDLNQENPHLMRYLIQNSIWWIESAKIDGIRMDTYPYADLKPMAQWVEEVQAQYPGFNIVGEAWYPDAPGTAFWQAGSHVNGIADTHLPTVMDFPTMLMASRVFNQNTDNGTGLYEIYHRLSMDYLYRDPLHVLTFLDNHDTDRFLLSEPKSLDSWKQAIAFLLTSRGIPQLYYGTELLMAGNRSKSDGNVRRDIPGGFPGDKVNQFIPMGRSELQNQAYDFIARLAKWRRGNDIIAHGSLKHFIPQHGVYVYQRALHGKSVTVIMNGTDAPATVDTSIYAEILPQGSTLTDVATGKTVTISPTMTLEPRALLILQ